MQADHQILIIFFPKQSVATMGQAVVFFSHQSLETSHAGEVSGDISGWERDPPSSVLISPSHL